MFKLWGAGGQAQHWLETRRELDRLRKEVAELKNELTLLRARSCVTNSLDFSMLGEQYWTGDSLVSTHNPAAVMEDMIPSPVQESEPDSEKDPVPGRMPDMVQDPTQEVAVDEEREAHPTSNSLHTGNSDITSNSVVNDWAVLKPPGQQRKWWKFWAKKPTYGRSV